MNLLDTVKEKACFEVNQKFYENVFGLICVLREIGHTPEQKKDGTEYFEIKHNERSFSVELKPNSSKFVFHTPNYTISNEHGVGFGDKNKTILITENNSCERKTIKDFFADNGLIKGSERMFFMLRNFEKDLKEIEKRIKEKSYVINNGFM